MIYNDLKTTGLKGGVSEDSAWQIQGYRSEYQTSVWFEFGALGSVESRTQISVDGETKRILGVFPDSLGALTRIDIGDRYARA